MMPNKRHSGLRATSIFAAFIVAALLSACALTDKQSDVQHQTIANEILVENINEVLAKDGIQYPTFTNEKSIGELKIQQKRAIEAQQQLADAEQLWKKKEQEEMEKEDDKKCQSFGAKLGTQPYIQCRVSLTQLHELQKQRAEEESQRNANAESYALQRRNEDAAIQRQRADDERLRDERLSADADRRQRSLGLLQLGAGLLQASKMPAPAPHPSPDAPSPYHSYRINGQVYNCNTFGNNTTCH